MKKVRTLASDLIAYSIATQFTEPEALNDTCLFIFFYCLFTDNWLFISIKYQEFKNKPNTQIILFQGFRHSIPKCCHSEEFLVSDHLAYYHLYKNRNLFGGQGQPHCSCRVLRQLLLLF